MSIHLIEEIVRIVTEADILPGGIWNNEAEANDDGKRQYPLAVLTVTSDDEEGIEQDTSDTYLSTVHVQITAITPKTDQEAVKAAKKCVTAIRKAHKAQQLRPFPDAVVSCWRASGNIIGRQRMQDGDLWVAVRVMGFIIERNDNDGD